MALTDTTIRNTKPRSKPFKLADTKGLFLIVTPTGKKWWRIKYRFAGKEKLLSCGVYPDTPLAKAREKRDTIRRLLADGVDPSENRKAAKISKVLEIANSFELVAREWHIRKTPSWVTSHSQKILRLLERDIFPWLGNKPIASITAQDILKILRRIEERGAIDTAHRAKQNCSSIFRYAISTGRAENDPAIHLIGALSVSKSTHHAAITNPAMVGELLRAIDGYQGEFITKCALRLAPLVFVRPGELRSAEWCDIDLKNCEWNIPAAKMKMREPLLVPLSTQAVSILHDIYALTGAGRYVFPSVLTPSRNMSENTILCALRRMGFAKDQMSGHGFRAMARTILDEVLGVRPDFIEHQLGHAVRDPNGRAYNRTAHVEERRKMMQRWADYLEELKMPS
jgi:integrase